MLIRLRCLPRILANRHSARSGLRLGLAATGLAALAVAACGPTVTTSASVDPASPSSTTSGPADPVPTSAAPQAGQTDTEWGRIWDEVPAGFPTFPGSAPADDAAAEPVSARSVVTNGNPQEIAAWMRTALETVAYRTEALSGPFEDGSYVLDSVGDQGCRIETRIAPLGGMTFVTIRYGAACPTG